MKKFSSELRVSSLVVFLVTAIFAHPHVSHSVFAEDNVSASPSLKDVQARAVRFLKLTQSADGTWTTANVPGITALCVTSLLQSGVPADDPTVERGLKFLTSLVRDDGGIYHPQTQHRNYETSISVLALSAANTISA